MAPTLTVTCPHCRTALEIDTEAAVIVSHTPPKDEKKAIDFNERLKELEEAKRRASNRVDEAMRAEKAKGRVLEDRFRKLLGEAKDSEDEGPPLKDIDL
jgi:hypothetical protein